MACRAVLFAITDAVMNRLLAAEDDDVVEAIIEEVEEQWDEDWLCELDKSWDALHRCFTDGELEFDNGEYPLNHAILGGRQLHEGDNYIVALVRPEQVVEVSRALQGIDEAELRERYNRINRENYGAAPAQMSEEDFEYALGWFEYLKPFYASAAAAGRAVIFTVDQ